MHIWGVFMDGDRDSSVCSATFHQGWFWFCSGFLSIRYILLMRREFRKLLVLALMGMIFLVAHKQHFALNIREFYQLLFSSSKRFQELNVPVSYTFYNIKRIAFKCYLLCVICTIILSTSYECLLGVIRFFLPKPDTHVKLGIWMLLGQFQNDWMKNNLINGMAFILNHSCPSEFESKTWHTYGVAYGNVAL